MIRRVAKQNCGRGGVEFIYSISASCHCGIIHILLFNFLGEGGVFLLLIAVIS